MSNRTAADDLSLICEFEMALRNLLVWQSQIRQIIEQYSDQGGPGVGLPLLDSTIGQVERLVAVIDTFRDMLAMESGAAAPPERGGRRT